MFDVQLTAKEVRIINALRQSEIDLSKIANVAVYVGNGEHEVRLTESDDE